MAVEQLITQHIDTWTSALRTRSTAGRGTSGKIDLYGIKKLRELILELAVRGKLVPQDPNDEPASELLKRIAAEKAELVKQGKIKKQKPLPEISEDEKPFELPVGWEWVRLGFITNYGECDKAEPRDATENTWIVELEDIEKNTSRLINRSTFSERPFKSSKNKFNRGDVLYGKLRPYLDKVLVADNDGVCTTEIIPIKAYGNIIPDYLRLLLKSPRFINYANESTHGMNLPRLGTEKATHAIVELTTFAEQQRIVEKVHELMSLCDQLEQQSLTSLDAHYQLVETLLATLTASQNAEELAENWTRISQHFDTLFTTEASIDALKQTILKLAVMGKLVPQDPNDEPASELLKRIEQEKAQLVKEGKIKKQKPLPPISEEEKPFELPVGWEWCRLGHCIHLISGQHLKPNEYTENIIEGAIPYITGPAEFGDLNPTYSKFTIEKRAVAEPKDILVTCKGAGLGKLNVANVEIAISRQLMAIRTVRANCDYFKLLLSSMYDYFQAKGVGIAIPGISREDVIEPVISLPPLNEQERIVSRVNALFGTCDHLKSRLQSAQQTQLHLADALTEAALN
ncbi:restriction endonuclease subunit S [Rahnella aceris]|uniref:restriction endonuclease subunit S n=1 Tax=Rahnella sp. (strain Y9602) TaxID=2703885 RepID=UPI0036509E87